jgi:hypothetical protein
MSKEVYGLCQWPDGLPGWGGKSDEKIQTCPFRTIGADAEMSPGVTFRMLAISPRKLIEDAYLYGSPNINSKWFCSYPQKLDIIECNFPDVLGQFEKDLTNNKL